MRSASKWGREIDVINTIIKNQKLMCKGQGKTCSYQLPERREKEGEYPVPLPVSFVLF